MNHTHARTFAFILLLGYQLQCALPVTEPVITKRDYQAGTTTIQLEGQLVDGSGCIPKYENREQIRTRLLAKLECSNFEILADGQMNDTRTRTTTTATPGYGPGTVPGTMPGTMPGTTVPNYGYGGVGQPGTSFQTQTTTYQVPIYWVTYRCVTAGGTSTAGASSGTSQPKASTANNNAQSTDTGNKNQPSTPQTRNSTVNPEPAKSDTSATRSLPVTSSGRDSDAVVMAPGGKLVWERCNRGQSLDNGECRERGTTAGLTGARQYCEALGLTARRWRLPSVSELKQLHGWNKQSLKDTGKAALVDHSHPYWAADSYEGSTDVGMAVDLKSGDAFAYGVAAPGAVRCVADR